MKRRQPEQPSRAHDAFWMRLAIGCLLCGLLVYGCWQALDWFAASFPRDFR